MSRGNGRQDIFLDDNDYREFLCLIGQVALRQGFRIHAYALMPNHYHILLETPRGELSAGLQWINGLYGQFFNRRHDHVGHLFQDRYKALLIDKNGYYLAVHRYIHQNPVKAGLATHPWDYEWSSCREFVGLRAAVCWLERGVVLDRFGEDAQEYARFLEAVVEKDPQEAAVGQLFLGGDEFACEMRQRAESRVASVVECSCRGQLVGRPAPEKVLGAVRTVMEKELPDSPIGRRDLRRTLEIFLLKEICGMHLRAIGARYGLSPSGVSLNVTWMRSRLMQDPKLVLALTRIEALLSEKPFTQNSRPDPITG